MSDPAAVERLARKMAEKIGHRANSFTVDLARPYAAMLVEARETLRAEAHLPDMEGRSCSVWGYDEGKSCPCCILLSKLEAL